ncbi:MAG: type II toxin-antitoxin system RelE/ParE family toxin [Candidatus Aminicenantes bacterium]|nr:type II toxin-antitoxin system RelE/ParE family toxin [Candidatus Aminicenantes bacterium]
MRYIFHPEALREYEETALYYGEVSAALAEAFIKSMEKGIEQILDFPGAWQLVEEDVRRHLLHRFPFGIYYTIEEDYIMIVAVTHMSRNPGYWKNRLKAR